MKQPPDEFRSRLAVWRVMPPGDPRFRSQVWSRIRGPEPRSWSEFLRVHGWLAIGGLTLALLVGAVAGREQARARVQTASNQFADTYVKSLDGRFMREP